MCRRQKSLEGLSRGLAQAAVRQVWTAQWAEVGKEGKRTARGQRGVWQAWMWQVVVVVEEEDAGRGRSQSEMEHLWSGQNQGAGPVLRRLNRVQVPAKQRT